MGSGGVNGQVERAGWRAMLCFQNPIHEFAAQVIECCAAAARFGCLKCMLLCIAAHRRYARAVQWTPTSALEPYFLP